MYSARITRSHKALIVLLIDSSESMRGYIEPSDMMTAKIDMVEYLANTFIEELLLRSIHYNRLNDYFDLSVISYSGNGIEQMLGGIVPLASLGFNDIPEVYTTHTEQSLSCLFHRWIKLTANGSTPMYAAIEEALRTVGEWCKAPKNSESFPPLVVNITDGEANDSTEEQLKELAAKLRAESTDNGNVLFFNIHTASSDANCKPMVLPNAIDTLPNNSFAHLLFEISSTMPTHDPDNNNQGTRKAMSFNCSCTELLELLRTGTSSIEKLVQNHE